MFDIQIVKTLGERQIDLNFKSDVKVVGLYGASGAGKTSILNMIAGLVKPESGHIKIGGEVLFDKGAGIHICPHKRGIGYVFQDLRLFPHLSVEQNLYYGRRGEVSNFNNIIDVLDIKKLFERSVHDLSGGEKQRVTIGRALLSAPKILLLDEPLASIDEARRGKILDYLVQLKALTHMPIIYVSHVLDEIKIMSDDSVEIK